MDAFAKTQSRPFYPDLPPLSPGGRRVAFWYSSLMAMHEDTKALRFEGVYGDSDMEALAGFSVSQVLDQRIGRATVSATVLLAVGALLSRSWIVAIGGFVVILALSAFVRYVILPRRLIRHAKALSGPGMRRVITVDAEGIHHRVEGTDLHLSRAAIRRMVLHKRHLFILLKPRGCIMLPLAWIQPPVTIETVVTALAPR